MKKRLLTAAIIAATSFTVYQIANGLATTERGYEAFGGEELALIIGLVIAAMVMLDGFGQKNRAAHPKANRPTTESEQSNNHFDA